MDVVSPGDAVDEDEDTVDEADEVDTDSEEETEETDVHDAEETDEPAPVADDAGETAYEQATGSKKD
jgi:hypothetical protein